MEKEFYMIYVEGMQSPVHKHYSIEAARSEAQRLALKMNKPVIILQSVKKIEVNMFVETDYRDLPF